jgi:eukaryotic-like serine/threonine-protein kinase
VSLATGTRLGRYEVEELIGAGGMGEVYRARDSHLRRAVAIKLLPTIFADDPERLRRFEQEARATAALNHPGVMAVYDVGTDPKAPYLVTELLDGATLRDRIKEERFSVARAVDFGTQIADGLTAAHGHRIVHRDLKPENLFVTRDGRVKILDFGLARLTAGDAAHPHGQLDMTGELSMPHAIIGTLGYMSPEQARGDRADHRADIFALGCVLYEMLEGKPAFGGQTPADLLSSVLKDTPPALTSGPDHALPPAVGPIVARCLEKDPDARFQSASDLAFALRSLTDASGTLLRASEPAVAPPKGRWPPWARPAGLVLAGVLVAGLALAFLLGRRTPLETPVVAEFLLPTPTADQVFASMPLPGLLPTAPQVGVSPDGRTIAFVGSAPDGTRSLWLRPLDASLPRVVEHTEGVTSWPFWSPDGRFIVIAAGRALRKINVAAGTVETLCPLPDETPPVPFVTGAWSDSGAILFSIGGPSGIYRVPAAGGRPEPVTHIDRSRTDNYHSWPQWLTGDRFLLFVRTEDPRTTGTYVASLSSETVTALAAMPSRAVHASGHLLWAIDDRLVAQPFDASGTKLTGAATTLVPSIFLGAGRTPAFWASQNGTLVYAIGDRPDRQFQWLDRRGARLGNLGPPGLFVTFDVSADASRVVVEIARPGARPRSTLALLDARGVLAPLTLGDANDSDPRFGPSGDVVFARNSGDSPGVMRIDPSGGSPSLVYPRNKASVLWMEDWAADGSSIVFRTSADRDAWQLLSGNLTPRALTHAKEPIEQVQLSPDGRSIAYNTQESGQSEVYLSPVPPTGQRVTVSSGGGVQPTWRADGRELYYLGLDGGLYAVDVQPGSLTLSSRPQLLFRTEIPVISAVVEQYRPTPDGQRFLFCVPLTSVNREPLRVLLNWPARLAQAR